MNSFERIKQRKLVQWGLAYLAGAWLALQVVYTLGDMYDWPRLLMRAVPLVLVAGFAVTVVLAWYHGERGSQRLTVPEALLLMVVVLATGLGIAGVARGGAVAEDEPVPATATRELVAGERAAVAVLPFENMSGDPTQEFFSDGLSEELINVLAQIPGLRVAARTSSFAFEGTHATIDSIGRALRVAHIVEGSVRRVGDRVRISAKLIDAATGYQRWSDSYDRELADVFAVQDEISRAIAEALRLTIAPDVPLAKQETTSPEAHALLLRGMAVTREGTPESYAEATRLYRQAAALDPGYARAYMMQAERLLWQAYFRYIPRAGYEETRALLGRALALDPELADAHILRGHLANIYEWDFARAREHLHRARALSPHSPMLHTSHTWLLMRLGRRVEAARSAQRGAEVDPLSFASHNLIGLVHLYNAEPERALPAFEDALALAPRSPHVLANYAEALSVLGRHDDAIRIVTEAIGLAPGAQLNLGAVGRVHARAGDRARAEESVRELLARPDYSPYLVARVHAALGEWESALERLEEAVRSRDDHANWIAVTPEFAPLHQDPRFQGLLERAGLRVGAGTPPDPVV